MSSTRPPVSTSSLLRTSPQSIFDRAVCNWFSKTFGVKGSSDRMSRSPIPRRRRGHSADGPGEHFRQVLPRAEGRPGAGGNRTRAGDRARLRRGDARHDHGSEPHGQAGSGVDRQVSDSGRRKTTWTPSHERRAAPRRLPRNLCRSPTPRRSCPPKRDINGHQHLSIALSPPLSAAGSRPRLACAREKTRKTRTFTPVQQSSEQSRLNRAESTMSTTPPFEIPTDMLKMIEQSMEQVEQQLTVTFSSFSEAFPAISWAARN